MSLLLHEGNPPVSEERDSSTAMQARIRELEHDLRLAQERLRNTEADNKLMRNAMNVLRKELNPQYLALQAIFGELDVISIDEAVPAQAPAMDDRKRQVWASWKQKLPGKAAEFIDALLTHGEMTAAQLRIACRCASDTVYQTIHKLNKAGLINKNGGKFSLKEL